MAPAATRPEEVSMRLGKGKEDRQLTYGLTSTTPAAPTARLDTVFLKVGIIGVARPWVQVCLRIIVRSLIFVLDQESNRSTEGNSHFRTRLDMDSILLISLQGEVKICIDRNQVQRTGVVKLVWPGRRRLSWT